MPYPSVHDFFKSSLKNQVRETGFLTCKNQFRIWFFADYTGSKNPVRNRLKIQFVEFDFSNLIFQAWAFHFMTKQRMRINNFYFSRCAKKVCCFDNRDKNGINKFGAEDVLNSLISSAQDAKCLGEGEICCKEEHVIKNRVKRDKKKCSEISGYR